MNTAIRTLNNIERDLLIELDALLPEPTDEVWDEDGPEGGIGLFVKSADYPEPDLIGAGEALSEAIADAIETVSGWQR